MDSFQAKIGWKMRMRKGKNKNYRSVPFRSYPMHNGKFQKNSKKIRNIKKKKPLRCHFKPKYVKMLRKREKKNIAPFRFYPMRNWKFQKNNKKIQKIKKYHNEIISSQSRLEKDGKKRK